MIRAADAAGEDFLPDLYFDRALESGRLAHAYLLVGPDSEELTNFALRVAKRFFCKQPSAGRRECGECPSCLSIEHENHAGVTVFGPPEGKNAVDIETVRFLCDRSHYTRDHAFLAVLEKADTMNPAAANALLKTLEEPPGEFVLVLTASSTGSLLPTLVSRCHRIPFPVRPDRQSASSLDEDLLAEVREADFHARYDVKDWLEKVCGDEETIKARAGGLVDGLIAIERRALDARSEAGSTHLMGRSTSRLEFLLELRESLDSGFNPDLVVEQVLAKILATD
ncbi:MAG: hypothetical protein AAF517_13330 [Planctomycetota bacterium]